ncbi:MAG: hypothetical protein GXX91_15275 [Verrucomicrobiaceae bacterium]|nr:hypothetical protein [Verrucomicrobiaceae bacterium]
MDETSRLPSAIQALSALSGVPGEEVTIQVAALLTALGGPHAGLMTLGDEFQPVGFHLLHLGGDSARQRRLSHLLFQPLRYLQEDLLAYSRLAPAKQFDSMSRAYVNGRPSDEHIYVDPESEMVDGTARKDVYHLADLSSEAISLSSPWRRREDVDRYLDEIGCRTLLPVDGIHRHLPGHTTLSQSAVGRHGGRCLLEPVILLDNPGAEVLRKPWVGMDRDAPLILEESGQLWKDALRSGPDRATLHRILRERAFADSSISGKERHRVGSPRLFSLVTEELGHQLLSERETEEFVAAMLIVRSSGDDTIEQEMDPDEITEGYRRYRDTLKGLARLRRIDALDLWWTGVRGKAALQFYEGQREFIGQLETVAPAVRPFAAGFPHLPSSILWSLAKLDRADVASCDMVTAALSLSERAMRAHLGTVRELRHDAEAVRIERKATEMLWKLSEVEPCTFRELVRKYAVQRRELHEPILNHLVEAGKVLRLDGSHLRLAESAREELGATVVSQERPDVVTDGG